MITQGDGKLRKELGRWYEPSGKRNYQWMQDCVSVYKISKNKIRRHRIKIRTRREISFEEEYVVVSDVFKMTTPMNHPEDRRMLRP